MKSQKLINAYNATSTDDGHGEIETIEAWLERQLIGRMQEIERWEVVSFDQGKEIQSLTEQLQKAKSCNKPCSPSDWMGKCKDNGCNNDGIDLDKFTDLEKEFS